MLRLIRQWLDDLPIADPLQREQAALLQAFSLFLLVAAIFGLPASLVATSRIGQVFGLGSSVLVLTILLGSLMVLRRGQFTGAVVLMIIGTTLLPVTNMIPTGLVGSRAVFMLMAVPIMLAGLVGTRRILALAVILGGLSVGGVGLLEKVAPTLVGFGNDSYDPVFTGVIFGFAASLLSLLVWRFGSVLKLAISRARSREQELEQLRDSLEVTVNERTSALEHALADVERRESALALTVDSLRASEAAVRELSAPIIPVLPGVLVAPLIGALNDARISALTDNVLSAITDGRVSHVIFDVTGVPLVDTQVAKAILDTAASARLLGTSTALVGVRPEVAQTIISLGIDLTSLTTYPTLQEAIVAILGERRTGVARAI
ncbi:MAG: STAS domain-containing protein [Chloroflexales bacterium]